MTIYKLFTLITSLFTTFCDACILNFFHFNSGNAPLVRTTRTALPSNT